MQRAIVRHPYGLLYKSVYMFFFTRHRYPSVLHSFPTRRSSDLDPEPSGGGRQVQLSGERCPGDQIAELDRKSTRLNSSHANISYAVFCVKKKNIMITFVKSVIASPHKPMVSEEEYIQGAVLELS